MEIVRDRGRARAILAVQKNDKATHPGRRWWISMRWIFVATAVGMGYAIATLGD